MFKSLSKTELPPWVKNDLAPLALRLGLAAIFLVHGYLKVKSGWGTVWWTRAELSAGVQAVVAWGEFIGAIALLVGFLSRLVALGIAVDMVGAMSMVTGKGGFVPITDPNQPGLNFLSIGYEYNFAIITICLALLLLGSGGLSLDHLLCGRKKGPALPPGPP